MKHSVMSFLAIVATLSSFISCQKEIETPKDDITSSHTVSFVADAPRTKTNATVDGNKVNYSWTKGDEDKFKVYEIVGDKHTPASTVTAILKDGLMEISATFGGEKISGASYKAVFNTGVKTVQTNNDETSYDQDSDILVSEVVSDPSNDFNNGIALKFKRLVAVNKATLKNLEKGDYLAHTIIETTDKKDLAGKYSDTTDLFRDCKSKISVKTRHWITGGTAPVNFITLPVADTKLKVTAVTIDGNNNFVAAYEKTFSKGISLTQGNLTSFGVLMSEKTGETIDLSIDETTTATTDSLTWDRTLVHVKVLKGKSTTDANNYYPGKSNTSTRFYKESTLAITPTNSLSISEIVFTATTENYATALANSKWTNATAFVSGKTVSIIPTDGTKEVSAVISATTGHTSIAIIYGQPKEITVPVYASVADLIAAGAPTTADSKVTVTLTDEEIIRFHTLANGTVAGAIIKVGTQEVEIFCKGTPSDWKVGGTISGTLTNCNWKLYNSTWELCPADYSELTYTAPLPTCATPVITVTENGAVSIACETVGATIHYTVGDNPADPTEADAVFSTVTLTKGQTIKAIAVAKDHKPSAVASNKYTAGGAVESKTYTLQFGKNYNSASIQNYTSTWSVTCDGFTWGMVNWNNNQNGWTNVRAGRKDKASVATITTKTTMPEAISTITMTIDEINATYVNSIKLEVLSADEKTVKETITGEKVEGNCVFNITNPQKDCKYKITVDCKGMTGNNAKNGFVQVSKVVYTNN